MSDEERSKFLFTLDKMGKLAARLQDICPEVFFVHLTFLIFLLSNSMSSSLPSVLLTLLVGFHEEHPARIKLSDDMLV